MKDLFGSEGEGTTQVRKSKCFKCLKSWSKFDIFKLDIFRGWTIWTCVAASIRLTVASLPSGDPFLSE